MLSMHVSKCILFKAILDEEKETERNIKRQIKLGLIPSDGNPTNKTSPTDIECRSIISDEDIVSGQEVVDVSDEATDKVLSG